MYKYWLRTRAVTVVVEGYVLEAAYWRHEVELESFREFTNTGSLVPQRGAFDVKSLGEHECPTSGMMKEMYEWSIRRWDADEPIVTAGKCSAPKGAKLGLELCDEANYQHPYWGRTAQEVREADPNEVRETRRNQEYTIEIVQKAGGVEKRRNVTVVKRSGESARYIWAHWQRYLGRRVFVEVTRTSEQAEWEAEPRRIAGLAESTGLAEFVDMYNEF